ncbi:urease accessory protein UreF [Sulfurospirillum sp. 1612]|uniref:urease accessory protein UreF n=1 Tax=Sulfurospirillum sp. 1612 TaxID=3094835 RepID=UPI002F9310CE
MENHTIHTKALSRLVQIFDGSFPSGSFVHSFGLEPHVLLDVINDAQSLKAYLLNLILDQYQKFEFAYVKNAYKNLQNDKLERIIKEDARYTSMQSYEIARASRDLGSNYLKHINFDIKKKIVKDYFKAVRMGSAEGNELMILSAYAYELDVDCDTFLLLWCKKNIVNIAYASLKISRIKPSQIQKLLFEFDDLLAELIANSAENISNFNPLFEEIIFQHKNLEPKLFAT